MITTDLDERDVILGLGTKKLEAALEHLRSRKRLGAMVFCSNTCVPVVSGDDVESVVERFRSTLSVPLVYLTTTPESMDGVFRELLVDRRLEAEKRCGRPRAEAINLVGFPTTPPLAELTEMLADLGVEVNVNVIPDLSPELVDEIPRASMNVFHPNELWSGLYEQILFDTRLRDLSPQAPYGLKATLAWLRDITTALNIDRDVEAVMVQRLESMDKEWEILRSRAREHTLGFILRAVDSRMLTDTGQTWGIPLVEATLEMGFTVSLYVHDVVDDGVARLRSWLSESHPEADVELVVFRDREALIDELERRVPSAVYTEHFFDRRLSERGIGAFSCQHFEPGPSGALRTLTRLVEVCELPFLKRYGRYFARNARSNRLPGAFGSGRMNSGELPR